MSLVLAGSVRRTCRYQVMSKNEISIHLLDGLSVLVPPDPGRWDASGGALQDGLAMLSGLEQLGGSLHDAHLGGTEPVRARARALGVVLGERTG